MTETTPSPTPSPTSALVETFSEAAIALAAYLAQNPGRLPVSECVKIAAAIATMHAVYTDSCDGGV